MPKLQLIDVHKSFGANSVCNGINFTVEKGELVCLIGASGSGKSTILRCINLLEPIDDGQILLDGEDITDPERDPRLVRRRVGLVFQSFNLFPHMTALENVLLAPRRVLRKARGGDPRGGRSPLRPLRSWRTAWGTTRTSSRAASSSASPSSARSPCRRKSCCWTRSPPPSIPNSWAKCWRS